MRSGSVDRDGLSASIPAARLCKYHACPGQVSYDVVGHKLVTIAVESFECLRQEGSDLVDQLSAAVIGGADGESLSRKGVCQE